MSEVVRPIVLGTATLAALAGCAEPAAPTASVAATVDTRIGQQGRLLLGFRAPDVRTFALPAAVNAPTVTADGALVADGRDAKSFIGTTLSATGDGATLAMRIVDAIAPDATSARWRYALEQWDPATQAWAPACAEPTPIVPAAVAPTPARAVVVPGVWRADGSYAVVGGAVTFACQTGVVGKCVGWGYGPSAQWPVKTVSGVPTTASAGDLLVACTRMAHADYCATGAANTLDGTPIQIDDVFHPYAPTPGFPFEAAWRGQVTPTSGAVALTPVCLSKLRWSTLPLGGGCPLTLPDPRVDGKAAFCDDLSAEALEQRGALLYSSSAYLDAGLYAHVDPSTGAALTTASLVPGLDHVPELPTWTIPAPADVPFPAAGQLHRLDATVFARALPAKVIEVSPEIDEAPVRARVAPSIPVWGRRVAVKIEGTEGEILAGEALDVSFR